MKHYKFTSAKENVIRERIQTFPENYNLRGLLMYKETTSSIYKTEWTFIHLLELSISVKFFMDNIIAIKKS